MKRSFHPLTLLALVALGMAGCTGSDDTTPAPTSYTEQLTLTAGMGTPDAATSAAAPVAGPRRISISETCNIAWEATDRLAVWGGSLTAPQGTLKCQSADSRTATFTGVVAYAVKPADDTPIYASVLSDWLQPAADGTITSDLTTYDGSPESGIGHAIITGQTTYGEKQLTMAHHMAMLRYSIIVTGLSEGNHTATVRLSGTGMKSSVTVNPATGTLTSTDGDVVAHGVTFANGQNTYVFLAMCPGTYSGGHLEVAFDDGPTLTNRLGVKESFELKAGYSYSVAANLRVQ